MGWHVFYQHHLFDGRRINFLDIADAALEAYYTEWCTFQMSDHLPLWVELKIDFSNEYLTYLSTYKPGVKAESEFSTARIGYDKPTGK